MRYIFIAIRFLLVGLITLSAGCLQVCLYAQESPSVLVDQVVQQDITIDEAVDLASKASVTKYAFRGKLPDQPALHALMRSPSLTSILVSDATIDSSHVNALVQSPNLHRIRLQDCRITCSLAGFATLPLEALEVINTSGPEGVDCKWVEDVSTLRTLAWKGSSPKPTSLPGRLRSLIIGDLQGAEFNLSILSQCPDLADICLIGLSPSSDEIESLARCEKLNSLSFEHACLPQSKMRFGSLRILSFTKCVLAENWFSDFKAAKLVALSFDGIDLRRMGGDQVMSLPQLRSVSFRGCEIGDGALRTLVPRQVEALRLEDQNLSIEECRAIGELEKLRSLDCKESRIGDEGVRAIMPLPDITWADFSGCNLTDASCRSFRLCKSLEVLLLDRTQVANQGLKELLGMHSLKRLQLWETQVSEALVEEIREAAMLQGKRLPEIESGVHLPIVP